MTSFTFSLPSTSCTFQFCNSNGKGILHILKRQHFICSRHFWIHVKWWWGIALFLPLFFFLLQKPFLVRTIGWYFIQPTGIGDYHHVWRRARPIRNSYIWAYSILLLVKSQRKGKEKKNQTSLVETLRTKRLKKDDSGDEQAHAFEKI